MTSPFAKDAVVTRGTQPHYLEVTAEQRPLQGQVPLGILTYISQMVLAMRQYTTKHALAASRSMRSSIVRAPMKRKKLHSMANAMNTLHRMARTRIMD
jgi:hypothetical protein